MSKFLSAAAAGAVMCGCLSAFVFASPIEASAAPLDDGFQIVTTIFPEYDWVKSIIGEGEDTAEITFLLDNGVDLHSYQPSADDILKISTCDLFIYVGGESDEWVADALQEAVNPDMVVIDLLDVLGDSVREEEIVEGMEHDHDHDHEDADHEDADHEDADHEDADHEDADHEDADHDHDHEEVEYDEHVWLSLRNTAVLVDSISQAMCGIDSDHADRYSENAASYIEKLNELDEAYVKAVKEAPVKTLLFGDRFPFRYLVDDYGLEYYAAFAGCSAETEASFETILFLANKVDELSLKAVLTIEGTDHRIAETIVQTTAEKDQKILTLDSLQSTTAQDVEEGATYLSIMANNLSVLQEALQQ